MAVSVMRKASKPPSPIKTIHIMYPALANALTTGFLWFLSDFFATVDSSFIVEPEFLDESLSLFSGGIGVCGSMIFIEFISYISVKFNSIQKEQNYLNRFSILET